MDISKNLSAFDESEVRKLFKKAMRVLKHPGLDVLCYPARRNFGRILVITPRKVGPSTQRNLIRRRLKSIFYEEKLYNNLVDYIIIIKKPGIHLDFKQLKEILMNIDVSAIKKG